MVALEGDEVVEGIGVAELARVDQAHEEVAEADSGSGQPPFDNSCPQSRTPPKLPLYDHFSTQEALYKP